MSKFDSPSAVAESPMEDPSGPSQNLPGKGRHRSSPTTTTVSTTTTGDSDGEVEAAEQGDPKAWAAFNKSFRQVQSVLDRNRLLIQQVNENHQSRIPDNMAKNVSLIQELNGNISKFLMTPMGLLRDQEQKLPELMFHSLDRHLWIYQEIRSKSCPNLCFTLWTDIVLCDPQPQGITGMSLMTNPSDTVRLKMGRPSQTDFLYTPPQ